MLAIEGLHVSYGGLAALSDVSIAIGRGEFVAVFGPNSADNSL
jgi:branched-chain amino acid transport system ATP-binding protein